MQYHRKKTNLRLVMEILKDAITPFYERVKRPFIGAYWMAAVAYNWKVWVALLFYKESVNGVDKITFIYSHINWQTLFLCPIFIAIGFLFLGSLLDLAAFQD